MPVFQEAATAGQPLSFWLAGVKQLGHGRIGIGHKRFENRLVLRPRVALGGDDRLLKFWPAIQNPANITVDEPLEVLVPQRA
jgi:hypothetical protein